MKKLLVLFLLFITFHSSAQFKSATLQASGLTCAMCSNAINKALGKLSFVEKVESDLNQSAFLITFKTGTEVDFEQLRRKVEDAGFSVAKLRVVTAFAATAVKNNHQLQIGTSTLYFVNVKEQVINGESTITILDKNFIPVKDYKKYSTSISAESYKTGLQNGKRIYHVTI
jgi:copper chaperone CopZ